MVEEGAEMLRLWLFCSKPHHGQVLPWRKFLLSELIVNCCSEELNKLHFCAVTSALLLLRPPWPVIVGWRFSGTKEKIALCSKTW